MSRVMSIMRLVKGTINKIVRRSYWYREIRFPDCSKFWNYRTFNTDLVNLGSTSGLNAFDYDGISLKCGNWALRANPLLGDLSVLRNYFSYLKENNATVIIPLCPFSSLSGSYNITEDRYYTILYPSTIPNFSLKRYRTIINERNNPFSAFPIAALFMRKKSRGIKNLTEQQMLEDAERWMLNWKKEFSISDFSYPLSMVNQDGIEDAAKIINEIIVFCRERNIRPVMLIPPVYHTLGGQLTPEIRKIVIDSLISKIDDKTVWYKNYMDDEEFTNDITLFENSYLLNKVGAKKFTKVVLKDIGVIE